MTVLNRQAFYDDCNLYNKSIGAVASLDMNGLKMLNDSKGHQAGDEALRKIGDCLLKIADEKTLAYRVGGDEFIVVIHGKHDRFFYEDVVTRIRNNVARDVTIGKVTLKIILSAGFARFPEDGTNIDDVAKKADDAMYNNKKLIKSRSLTPSSR